MTKDLDRMETDRLTNLARAYDWKLDCIERTDLELKISFVKPRLEPIPEDAVGADYLQRGGQGGQSPHCGERRGAEPLCLKMGVPNKNTKEVRRFGWSKGGRLC